MSILGLILNDFNLSKGSLKLNCFLSIFILMLYVFMENTILLFVWVFMMCLMIPASSFSCMNVMRSSKWDMIIDEFPIKRRKIILSRYVLFIIMSFVSLGITIAILKNISVGEIVLGDLTFTINTLMGMYFVDAQLICIFYYPLIYRLKSSKIDSVIVMAIGASFVVLYLIKDMNPYSICVLILIGYIVSFLITNFLDKKASK